MKRISRCLSNQCFDREIEYKFVLILENDIEYTVRTLTETVVNPGYCGERMRADNGDLIFCSNHRSERPIDHVSLIPPSVLIFVSPERESAYFPNIPMFPENITLFDSTYQLFAIHFLQPSMKPQNGHYTSCFRFGECWLYYNGLRRMCKPPFLSRWLNPNRKNIFDNALHPSLFMYVRVQ